MDSETKSIARDFVKWIKVKVKLQLSDENLVSYKKREIWWASVGLNLGSEQNGKQEQFHRPVLVLRKFGHKLFLAIPLTSKDKPHKFRLKIGYREYYENATGMLCYRDKSGILVLNQIRSMSSKRLIRKMGVMSEDDFETVREKVKKTI